MELHREMGKFWFGEQIVLMNWVFNLQKVFFEIILGKSYVIENKLLNSLILSDFCCGHNFTLGISYHKPKIIEPN